MVRFNRFALIGIVFLAIFTLIRIQWNLEPDYQAAIDAHITDPYELGLKRPMGWESPAGLIYGDDPSPEFPHRMAHVLSHMRPDLSEPVHSQFIYANPIQVLKLVDTAWGNRGPPDRQDWGKQRDVYTVNMKRFIGKKGQTHLRIVTERDSADIVTAYPVFP